MYLLQAINSHRQARLLNVFGETAMFWDIKKKSVLLSEDWPLRAEICRSDTMLMEWCE
jgi:hypothetical protein